MSERIRTGLIILGIYAIFCLYLLFVSYRVEKLDNDSYVENAVSTEKADR